jgi:hypothetical protein
MQGVVANRVVPFDYVAEFPIAGRPGQLREFVINISPDGPFTAVAIGYGFDEDRARPLDDFTPPSSAPGALRLADFPPEALMDGLRVNPRFLAVAFQVQSTADGLIPIRYSTATLDTGQLKSIFERVQPPSPIDFFLSIIDTASGREFQDQPSFSLASLGESTGRRPFRALPVPVRLDRRTSLRLQVVERTPGVSGTLFIDLIGYHELAGGCSPAPYDEVAALSGRMIPFDYVTRVRLTGQPDRRVEDEIVVDGTFVASSISYGVQTDSTDVTIARPPSPPPPPPDVDIGAVTLEQLPIRALVEGFRIRPNMVRLAFQPGGTTLSTLPRNIADRVFETLNRPDAVSFRYTLFDGGLGRDLQNQSVHNTAGLGSAQGERPFKHLAKPLRMEPSSVFRVSVQERFGRGELYVVLQGYRAVSMGGSR